MMFFSNLLPEDQTNTWLCSAGNQDGSREQETEEGTNEGTSQRRLGLIASVVFVLIIGILSLVLCSRNQNG